MTDCPEINPESAESFFHWNNEPECRVEECECSQYIGEISPVRITGYFVDILKNYLSDPSLIGNPVVKTILQSSTPYIASLAQYNPAASGQKPRILIEFGGMKAQQDLAINNKFYYNMENGSQDYSDAWHIAFTVYIIAETLNETLQLSQEVCNFFHHYQWIIQKQQCWSRFQVNEMQKPQCIDDGNGAQTGYVVPLSMTVIAEDHWNVTEISPALKRVEFTASNSDF